LNLSPELIDAIAPYGIAGFLIVVAVYVFSVVMKNRRVKLLTKAGIKNLDDL